MMTSSNTKSYGASIIPKQVQKSISPSGKFCSSEISSSSSTSMSSFSSPKRASSPNQISDRWGPPLISIHRGCVLTSTSVPFSIDHRNASTDISVASSSSREKNQSVNHRNGNKEWSNRQKKTCMCSPTTHPGSFRCSLHKNVSARNGKNMNSELSYQSHRFYSRRSEMTNSLVRIGMVEGDLVKRALASLIRPSSHQQRRRCDFQPTPSRLSVMSKAGD
ncbi:uncharacterized protein LOC111892201 [Lactuca sativa]|uniref:uncharacterized protein LOC111892201 n=1 Tax=Lactuca sativa TaxID=4236 RepID=UPI001C6890E4|nr:uncharacterized protein LOC111892201 [Lactuca sativa]